MIEWHDAAIILSARAHGEKAAIVAVLAREQGRYAGLVAGGQGQSWQGVLQPGNPTQARWRARLPEHLGHFAFDTAGAGAARWLQHPPVLAAIASACVMTEQALPERQPLPKIYDGLSYLLAVEDAALFGAAYVQWELGLLAALGYGLDLSACAVTQQTEELLYVSPRSGRAVSRAAGAAYHDRLLPLPGFLRGEPDGSATAVAAGLQLTGHFLARHIFHHTAPRLRQNWQECLPAARRRLAALYYQPMAIERVA
jgi:DNA repair protein RecO (recombination protein O)